MGVYSPKMNEYSMINVKIVLLFTITIFHFKRMELVLIIP